MALTDKQERFCQEYLIDLNATQSAIRTGYSKKTAGSIGQENLTKPEIAARIKELQSQREIRTKITADKVLTDIEEIRIRCMQKEMITDREGNPTGEWKFEAHGALKACEMFGKYLKLFTDKIEHSGNILESMTDEDLQRRLKELRERNK